MLVHVYILFIGLLVPAQLMQSYASCLLPSLLRCCSCLFFLCRSLLVLQLFCCVSFSAILFLQPLLCSENFAMHAGIACLHCVCWESMSELPDLWLVSIACWDSVSSFPGLWLGKCMLGYLSMLLHAGINCLASLASDWVTACWDSLVVLSMLG